MRYLALGGEVVDGPSCRVIRKDAAAIVHDVNHLQVDEDARAEEALAFLEASLGDRPYRKVYTGPTAPPDLVARLVLEDYVPDPTLQLLLEGDLEGPPPIACDIRPVLGDLEWEHLDHLVRAGHVEIDQKDGTQIYSEELTRQMQSVRRWAADHVQFFLARVDDEPVGFFSSWPGVGGLGMVEDLFTLPSHRNRGIARALIHHCVADARARGAGAVLIGAEVDDTPKSLYAALGFKPTCVTYGWLKQAPGETGAA
jgi:GNAT superfamily N-acetyltransferase